MHCVFISLMYPGRFSFKLRSAISPAAHFKIGDKGRIVLGDRVAVRRNSELSVAEYGELTVGNRCFFNNNVHIACHEKITIGDGTRFGPGAKAFDHDYDYKDFQSGKHITSPIIIGNNVWIGANAVLLRGTQLGDGCVVAAGCVVKGIYPPNSLIIQKRHTEVSVIER